MADTAADAPQIEPLRLTLEEAAQLVRDTPCDLGPRSLVLTPDGWAVLTWLGANTAAYALEGDAHGEWRAALEQFTGRPVVPRDPTAELVEFLERIGAFDENLEAANSPELLPCFNQRLYDEWKQLSIAARAALARVKGEGRS